MDNSKKTPASLSPRVAIMELSLMCSVPMSLKAALTLNVFEIMAESMKPMSAQEIVKKMPKCKSPNYDNLDRIMKLLASYHVFEENVVGKPTRYKLTDIGKAFVSRKDSPSMGSLVSQDKECFDTWQSLHVAVTDGDVEPFVKLHGKTSPHQLAMENPQVGSKLYIDSMASTAMLFMKVLLDSPYKGFEGVKDLVDIGGGTGKSLSMIVTKYPTMEGINFDLPHVIERAPSYTRVKHENGRMLESVPAGDAMLLNRVLHNWGDDQCKTILKNCHKRVGKKGKVIVIDCVLPNKTDATADCRAALELDLYMMAFFRGAKERSLNDLEKIAGDAGFSKVKLAHQLGVLLSVVELSN